AGDDDFGVETRTPDSYRCGEGVDSILYAWSAGGRERLPADCEETTAAAGDDVLQVTLSAVRSRRGHALDVRVRCLLPTGTCRSAFLLRRRGGHAVLARTGVRRIAAGASATVRLVLPARAPRRLELGIRARNGARTGAPLYAVTARRATG
ncbi:MAG TPA: hypothetical protein VF533_20015, partial [Solirubrobacteraceae bacterium]